ncbi:hypothetical protein SLEP1_g18653 [Rubroshorea leprosula]|uniref:Pectinesterase inhibitor domain-containing protein n=1 Tax=Rubroshorea leprosula TaxID=152421 RepID=A0AAV5IY67_9ROSI|nr:hypothetical protein SLEP1_g18653 [Rubroshorea leprosula]
MIFLYFVGSIPSTAFADKTAELVPVIEEARSNAQSAINLLNSLQQTTDPTLKSRYTNCIGYYNQVSKFLIEAEGFAKTGLYTDVGRAASSALETVLHCEGEFKEPPPAPSSLQQINTKESTLCNNIFNLSGSPPSVV